MQLSDFNFDLPDALIARYPTPRRSACRLLSLDGNSGNIHDGVFTDLLSQLRAGDLLVFNNTKVIPARLYGVKDSGGKVEILVERILDNHRVLAHVKASKSPRAGATLFLGEEDPIKVTVVSRSEALFELQFPSDVLTLLERIGHIPLPPYMDRADEPQDRENYQTVYGIIPGAIAAPTAGLHFDQELLEALEKKGVESAFVTLHVGAGTFQPVRVADIKSHQMHSEYAEVSEETVCAVEACKARGGRVIGVGSTSVRALESAALAAGTVRPFYSDTAIFIYPGFEFKVVDAMITNFHLPESTLLMLVSAFAGYDNTMKAYHHAVKEQFRFFSYGDAMWITKKTL